jgi:hypothetical protein
VLRDFLHCGLLEHGFATLWCAECRRELLTEMGRAAAEDFIELVHRGLGGDARSGLVVSIANKYTNRGLQFWTSSRRASVS